MAATLPELPRPVRDLVHVHRGRAGADQEEPFRDDDSVARLYEVGERRSKLHFLPVDDTDDLNAAGRPPIGDSARQRQCL